jgi:regulator of replication initiation timing
MSRTTLPAVDLEPIDRLEEKVKLLIGMIGRLKAEQARTVDENARLTKELDAARARLADMDASTSEATALRKERETIRHRVADMLEQLDALHL